MMRKYLKESLHWLYLTFFKPVTLAEESKKLSKKEALAIYRKTITTGSTMVVALQTIAGAFFELAGIDFTWFIPFTGIVIPVLLFGLLGGLVFRLDSDLGSGLAVGLIVGPFGGLVVGLIVGLGIEPAFELGSGLVFGLVFGLLGGLLGGLVFRLDSGLGSWLAFGLIFVLLGGLIFGLIKGLNESLYYLLGYSIAFLFAFFRPFYLLPYAFQYWRSMKSPDPFGAFLNSPVYWDEAIAMPLPYLAGWLMRLTEKNQEQGLKEINFVSKLPYQRRAAQKALVALAIKDLQEMNSPEEMADAINALKFLPAEAEYLPNGLDEVQRRINRISGFAQDYRFTSTPITQAKVLAEMLKELKSFRDAMTLVKPPVGPSFHQIASRWMEIIEREEAECRKLIDFTPIPNPFIDGPPLQARDNDLFKGRTDIIRVIEENIIEPNQRPALLLYGRRRIGKSSTLLSLPRLMNRRFIPVFIDFQDVKWREGNSAFCYHLSTTIFDELRQLGLIPRKALPRMEEFEKYPFTALDDYLNRFEKTSRIYGKQILLTFDEYEKLEEGIASAKITRDVFDQFRNIVQHRQRIVVLFSGGHRFEEMRGVNWSDYLINVKTLELSFLSPEDARELIVCPVPNFNMQYEPGVVMRILELTHCQPYLLQALASNLVNYLNTQHHTTATADDLEIAIEKTLVTAQAYFSYTWTEDCSEAEREVLRAIAINENKELSSERHLEIIRSLCHKEILERAESGYRFTIELFRLWALKNQIAVAHHDQV